MQEYEIGMFATSKSGHDKDNLYVIIKVEPEYVYLSDGKYKTLSHPKKKNKKHIQVIHKMDEALAAKYNNNETIRDEEIKRAIKLYKAGGEV